MKAYGRVAVQLHSLFISVVDGGDWKTSYFDPFTPGENSGTHWIGSWVGLRAVLDIAGKETRTAWAKCNYGSNVDWDILLRVFGLVKILWLQF